MMLKKVSRQSGPHITAVLIFLFVTLAYFFPVLEGKRILQPDIVQFQGMAKEIADFREETGKEALWTNSMFSGMPAYLISVKYSYNIFRYIDQVISLGLPVPAKYLFMSLLGFYILLLAFRVDPWLAIAGALAFGFSTYFFIIEAAGHNTKAHAMVYMAPVIAGIVLTFRGKVLVGALLTGVALALQIYTNHLQITYYTLLIVIVYGIFWLINSIRERQFTGFMRNIGILIIPVLLAVAVNFTNLYLVWEYGKHSMRGPSELTINNREQTTGLDKSYILDDYSYGITETMNLLIPGFKGVSSSYDLGQRSSLYKVLSENGVQGASEIVSAAPAYWGPQRFTSGPVYIGATVIFLFVLALFGYRGRYRWWLISATLLSITLAWGKNFMFLSEFFIDFIPGYNKFRTVSMILVIAELTIPLLAILGLRELFNEGFTLNAQKAIKKTLITLGSVIIFFILFAGILFSFEAPVDQQLLSMGWPGFMVDALQSDRLSLLRIDAFRSLIFVVATAGLIWVLLKNKISLKWTGLAVALIILADLWPVGNRFLSHSDFTTQRELNQPFLKSEADVLIERDKDPYYRVYNTTRSPFNDAISSYHHKSIGGYHGAKLQRYQDLIDFHLSRNNMQVLNMLNAKYFIQAGETGQPQVYRNPGALGNAWFVNGYKLVADPDEEIMALDNFDPLKEAIIDERFKEYVARIDLIQPQAMTDSEEPDTLEIVANLDLIELTHYSPNHLKFRSISSKERIAVFSDIYYQNGWQAYINGNETDHFRANYVLRAMVIPGGNNEIEFVFKPAGYYIGEIISLIGSLIFLLVGGVILRREVLKMI